MWCIYEVAGSLRITTNDNYEICLSKVTYWCRIAFVMIFTIMIMGYVFINLER